MKESYRKDPASHPDPESCGGGREAAGEALTGVNAGQAIELRNQVSPGCRRCRPKRKATPRAVLWQAVSGRRAVVDPVHAWKLFAREPGDPADTRRLRGDGSAGKGDDRTSGMHVCGKSDGRIVPKKPPN